MEARLSCYLVLLSTDIKTSNKTVTPDPYPIFQPSHVIVIIIDIQGTVISCLHSCRKQIAVTYGQYVASQYALQWRHYEQDGV